MRLSKSLFRKIFIAIFVFAFGLWGFNHKSQTVFVYDAAGYYSYLPAIFIYKDIKYEYVNSLPDNVRPKPEGLNLVHAGDGRVVTKWPVGVSILLLPFFLLAHLTSIILGQPANGYSVIYEYTVYIAALFYLLAGLLLQKKILLFFYSESVTAFTILAIALGTNLFWYSTYDVALSHCYSFFLFSLFLYVTIKWHARPAYGHSAALGAILGLITMVRPSNLVIVSVFLLYGVISRDTFQNKLFLFARNARMLLVMVIGFCIAILPQLIYWKLSSGEFIFNSYGEEKFYFNNPHILEGLFGFRKGWFIYTPLMLFILPGFIRFFKLRQPASIAILVFILINIYVVFSWWSWWYGGSFGARPLVETYALLSLPLAAAFDWLREFRVLVRRAAACFVTILILLNLFQTYQYALGIIDFQRMTFKAYVGIFGRVSFPENYQSLLKEPDFENAEKGLDER